MVFATPAYAAPLTTEQATSLIGVVQSSPTTPASAFTNLITAFSNITVVQAESLITVVQAAPGVPANAFVNLLVSFTVDPVSSTEAVVLGQKIDNLTTQLQQTQQSLQTVQQNVVEVPVVPEVKKELTLSADNCRFYATPFNCEVYIYYSENGVRKSGVEVTVSSDDEGIFQTTYKPDGNPITVITGGGRGDQAAYLVYVPKGPDMRVITATANGITVTGKAHGKNNY